MTCFTSIPLEQCVGAGSGLDSAGIRHKYEVLKQSMEITKATALPGTSSATLVDWKW